MVQITILPGSTFFICIALLHQIAFIGALSMLEIKPDELMVGSGDGSVCLIRDTTLVPKSGKGRSKSMNSGVSTTVKEPTEPCLTEVSRHIESNRLNINVITLIAHCIF